MKNLMIMAIVVLGIIGCKKDPEIVEVTKEVVVEPQEVFTGTWTNDTLFYKNKWDMSVPWAVNNGMAFLEDSAKVELGNVSGYYGYSYENDSLYLFEVNAKNSIQGKVNWINENDIIFEFTISGYNTSFSGRFKRK